MAEGSRSLEVGVTMSFSGTKDATCYGCGPENPLGLRVPFERDGEKGGRAEYVARREHGGVTFSLMDEAFGWCLFFQDIPAVTAKIETRFHKPIQIGASLEVKAWVVRQRRKLFDARAEVRVGGELVAESDAVLCTVAVAR